MRHASWFVCLVGVLASAASAEDQTIHWQPNLEAAERLAAKTNRLVLIHFWAPWCGPCMNMERTVFAQPEVGPALEPNFVMVKLNADDSQATARIYQVMTLPTDVIVTPSGRMITSMPSSSKPQQYVAQLNQAAATYKQVAQGSPAGNGHDAHSQNPYGTVLASSQAAAPVATQNAEQQAQPYAAQTAGATTAAPQQAPQYGAGAAGAAAAYATLPPNQYPAGAAPNGAPQAGQPGAPYGAGPGQPPAAAQAQFGAPAYGAGAVANAQQQPVAAPAGPTDALDGYCCVTLVENKKWVRGDVRFGAIHRGRIYKFVSQEAQQRFLANPDAFSPVLQGIDPVLALDSRQAVPGSREHGLFYERRIYLFSSEDSLKRFQSSPTRYAAEVTQAMR
jgi:protein disulfide-isomerase